MNPLPSRGFTWNIKSYFLWKTMKKYLWMSSAAVVLGALRVKFYCKNFSPCAEIRRKLLIYLSQYASLGSVHYVFPLGAPVAPWVKLWPSNLAVLDLSPAWGGNLFNLKQGSIAHSLSLSPAHGLDISGMLLKRTKIAFHLSICYPVNIETPQSLVWQSLYGRSPGSSVG